MGFNCPICEEVLRDGCSGDYANCECSSCEKMRDDFREEDAGFNGD